MNPAPERIADTQYIGHRLFTLENATLYDESMSLVSLIFSTFLGSEEGNDAETSAEAKPVSSW